MGALGVRFHVAAGIIPVIRVESMLSSPYRRFRNGKAIGPDDSRGQPSAVL